MHGETVKFRIEHSLLSLLTCISMSKHTKEIIFLLNNHSFGHNIWLRTKFIP